MIARSPSAAYITGRCHALSVALSDLADIQSTASIISIETSLSARIICASHIALNKLLNEAQRLGKVYDNAPPRPVHEGECAAALKLPSG